MCVMVKALHAFGLRSEAVMYLDGSVGSGKAHGVDVTVVCGRNDPGGAGDDGRHNSLLTDGTCARGLCGFISMICSVSRMISRNKYNLVVGHDLSAGLASLVSAWLSGCPCRIYVRDETGVEMEGGPWRLRDRLALRIASEVIRRESRDEEMHSIYARARNGAYA